MESLKKVKLKCRYDNEIRAVILAPDSNFNTLRKRLNADYNFEVSLKYEDTEGDLITLSSQNDLDDLLNSGISVVNVIVSEALPSLQRHRSAVGSRGGVSILTTPVQTENPRDWHKGDSLAAVPSPMSMRSAHQGRFDRFPSVPQQNQSDRVVVDRSIRWKRGEILGQGAFGVVYLGLDIDTGGLMAVKQMAIEEVSSRELSNLENEINLLKTLEHPNIVRYLGTEVNVQYLTIFLEYVPGGSVRALIDKFGPLEEPVARSYTRQLLLGLEYLHRSGIAHRDIKGANCLVGNDGVIKLADFGASKHWRSVTTSVTTEGLLGPSLERAGGNSKNSDIRGTPQWMAPEVVRGDETSRGGVNWKKADIWSLGCTAIEMTTGRPPWYHLSNPVTVLYHIACSTALPNFPDHASPELVTFLNLCLQRDPQRRPEVTSLLLHPFVANVSMGPSTSQYYNMTRPTTVSTMPSGNWMVFGGGLGTAHDNRGKSDRSRNNNDGKDAALVVQSVKSPRPGSGRQIAMRSREYSEPEPFLFNDMRTELPFGSGGSMKDADNNGLVDLDASLSSVDLNDPRSDHLYNSMSHEMNLPTYPRNQVSGQNNRVGYTASLRDYGADDVDPTNSEALSDTSSLKSGIPGVEEWGLLSADDHGLSDRDRWLSLTQNSREHAASKKNSATNQMLDITVEVSSISNTADADSVDLEASTPNLKYSGGSLSPRLEPMQLDKVKDPGRRASQKQSLLSQATRIRSSTEPTVDSAGPSSADSLKSESSTSSSGTTTRSKKLIAIDKNAEPTLQAKSLYSPLTRAPMPPNSTPNSPKAGYALSSIRQSGPHSASGSPTISEKKNLSANRRSQKSIASPKEINKSSDFASSLPKSQRVSPVTTVNTSGLVGIILEQRRALSSSNSLLSLPDDARAVTVGSSNRMSDSEDEDIVAEDDKVFAYRDDMDSPNPKQPVQQQNHQASTANFTKKQLVRSSMVSDASRHTQRSDPDDAADEVPEEGPSSWSGPRKAISRSNDRSADIEKDAAELSSDEDDAAAKTNSPTWTDAKCEAKICTDVDDPFNETSERDSTKSKSPLASTSFGYFDSDSHNGRLLSKDTPAQNLRENRAATSMPEKSSRSRNNSVISLSGTASQPNLIQVSGSSVSKRSEGPPSSITGSNRAGKLKSSGVKSAAAGNAVGKLSATGPVPAVAISSSVTQDSDIRNSLEQLRVSGAATAKPVSRVTTALPPTKGHTNETIGSSAAFGSKVTQKERTLESLPSRDFSSLKIHGTSSVAVDTAMGTFTASNDMDNMHGLGTDRAAELLCESLMESIENAACAPTVLSEHSAAITRLRVVPKHNILLSSSMDGTVRVWGGGVDDTSSKIILDTAEFNSYSSNPGSAKPMTSEGNLSTPSSTRQRIMSVCTDSNFDFIWGACSDGSIRLWQGGSHSSGVGKSLRLLKGHEDSVTVLEGAGGLVASGSNDRSVRVWDHRLKRSQIHQFRGHTDSIMNVRWTNGGREVISASKDKTVKIWDFRSGRMRANLERHFGAVTALKVVPPSVAQQTDTLAFVSVGRDSMLHGWSLTGDCVGSQAAHRGPITCISDIRGGLSYGPSASQGAPLMLSSGADGLIKLWDLRRMKILSDISTVGSGGSSNTVSKIIWLGEAFVTATTSGSVHLWNHRSSLDCSFGSISESATGRTEWLSHPLGEHSFSCTDLVASDNFLACSSKSGVIFKWQ